MLRSLDLRRALIVLATALALALLVAAGARSASGGSCTVATSRTLFETTGLQVYLGPRRKGLGTQVIACVKASHRRVTVDRIDRYTNIFVDGLLDNRYLWTREGTELGDGATAGEVLDLSTGKSSSEVIQQDDSKDMIAVSGGAIVYDGASLFARPISGRSTKLAKAPDVQELAASGHEVYWLDSELALHSVRSPLAPADAVAAAPARVAPAAQVPPVSHAAKKKSHVPTCFSARTTTILRLTYFVVARTPGGTVFACDIEKGRRIDLRRALPGVTATGPPTDETVAVPEGVGALFYRLPVTTANGPESALILLDPLFKHQVVRSALVPTVTKLTQVVTNAQVLRDGSAFAYTDGTTLTMVDQAGAHVLDRGTISALATQGPQNYADDSNTDFHPRIFWTNAGLAKFTSFGGR